MGSSVEPTNTSEDALTETMAATQSGRWITSGIGRWEDPSEQDIFDVLYDEVAASYFESALSTTGQGQQALRIFSKYKDVVQQWAQAALHADEIDDSLDADLNLEAEGRSQATMRPLQPDSLSSFQYVKTPGSTGQFDVISTDTATANEQAYIILGYYDPYAGEQTGYSQIQEEVSDSLGTRRPIPARLATEVNDSLSIIERNRGPLPVWPGDDIQVSLDVYEAGIKNGVTPIGFEVVTQNSTGFGSVLD
jgi:hypothetical protein